MEEDNRRHRRQELLDRLAGARTPAELANARAAADSWLADNPEDDDVRRARERLETASSEEDLEAGIPTLGYVPLFHSQSLTISGGGISSSAIWRPMSGKPPKATLRPPGYSASTASHW